MKLLGVGMILISSYMFSQYYVLLMKKRINTMENFIRFFSNLETRISYDCSHFLQIFAEMAERETGIVAHFLKMCLDEIEKRNDLRNAWNLSVENLVKEKALTREVADILIDYAKGLGESDAEGQKSNIMLYKEAIAFKLKDAQKDFTDKSKLTISSCIFVGLFFVILLV